MGGVGVNGAGRCFEGRVEGSAGAEVTGFDSLWSHRR